MQEEKTEIQSPVRKERIYIKPTVKSYLQVILITVFLSLILVGILAYRIRKIIRKREAQKRKALELELWALRSQINPHFLFNTFNSLINIIEEQTSDEAIDFVQELSKTYRYLLTTNSSDLSTIENELDFLRSYLFLLENRYGENLKTEIDISESYYQNKVPSLSLHLLVENAIKHNVISDKKPLTVHISIDNNDFLNISNAIQRKTTFVPSTKIGLENIRRRYEFYTEQTTEIIDDGENFTVKIPLLKSD